MAKHRPTARAVGGPTAAVVLLISISAARFIWPHPQGVMLFAVIPIALLGIMLGFRAGLLAALAATVVAIVWAVTSDHAQTLSWLGQPITFFSLGGLTGYYAKGALGDFDLHRARTCAHVRHAIDRGEIRLHYQPIVRASGELYAVEALARWQDPARGTIPPMEFIPDCEGDDQTMWELTLHTVRQAIQDSRVLDDGVVVAVNLSPVSLRRLELPGAIDEVIGNGGLQSGRIAVEVTETAISSDDESRVVDVLGQLKRAGVSMVAVDDFGIGHSSLARLGRLPIDTVKIDRTLIAESERPETAAVIRGMIELAHAVNLTVVAEGVEDTETWDWLVEAKCDAIQGFKLSRPMPPDELPRWLEAYEGGASLTPA